MLYFLLVALITVSCSKNDIRRVDVVFLPQEVMTLVSIECGGDIYGHGSLLLSKEGLDDCFVQQLGEYLPKLEPCKEVCHIDTRMELYIRRPNKHTDTLCIGAWGGICYKGQMMQDDSVFHQLVTSYIYSDEIKAEPMFPDEYFISPTDNEWDSIKI